VRSEECLYIFLRKTFNPDYALELSIILLMLVSWVFVTHSKVNPKVN